MTYLGESVEVREQLAGVGSSLPPHGSWGWTLAVGVCSGHAAEPAHRFPANVFYIVSNSLTYTRPWWDNTVVCTNKTKAADKKEDQELLGERELYAKQSSHSICRCSKQQTLKMQFSCGEGYLQPTKKELKLSSSQFPVCHQLPVTNWLYRHPVTKTWGMVRT